MSRLRSDLPLGVVAAASGAFALAVWIPLDVETSVIDVWRRQTTIGDAMLPTAAAAGLTLAGLLTAASGARAARPAIAKPFAPAFPAALLALLTLSLLLMMWVGPTASALLGPEGASYRELRDTAPWKHLGFVAGGLTMVAGLILLAERRADPGAVLRAALWATIAVVGLIALFDLPFDDLLLPPNGDF
ncbi:MAG: hypothetical protein AAFU61_00505 [Pseudomonadota bacterium]